MESRWSLRSIASTATSALGFDSDLREVLEPEDGPTVDAELLRRNARRLAHAAEAHPGRLMSEGGHWLRRLNGTATSEDGVVQEYCARAFVALASRAELRLNLVAADCLHPLIYLAQVDSPRANELAAEALDALGVYSHDALQGIIGCMGFAPLKFLASCDDVRAQRPAAAVLRSVLAEDGGRAEIVKDGHFGPTVLALAVSTDREVAQIAEMALQNMPITNSDLVMLTRDGVLPEVVKLARRGDGHPIAQQFAANVLSLTAEMEVFVCAGCSASPIVSSRTRCADQDSFGFDLCEACAALLTKDALPSCSFGNHRQRPPAHESLNTVCLPVATVLRQRLCADGGLRALLSLLGKTLRHEPSSQRDPSNESLQHRTLKGLAALTFNVQTASVILEAEGLQMLVKLLESQQKCVLRACTTTLVNLTRCGRDGSWQSAGIATAILDADAVNPLLCLIHTSDIDVLRNVACVLTVLSAAGVDSSQVIGAGDSDTCQSIDEEPSVLSMTATERTLPSSSPSSPSLFPSWSSSSRGALCSPTPPASASSVGHLAPTSSGRKLKTRLVRSGSQLPQRLVEEAGGIEWLSVLSDSDDWVVKRCTAQMFEALALRSHAWLSENASGVLGPLVALATAGDEYTQLHALNGLAAVLKYSSFQTRLVADGGMRELLMCASGDLTVGPKDMPKRRALGLILRQLSSIDTTLGAMLQRDVAGIDLLELLLELSEQPDDSLDSSVAYVIAQCSSSEAAVDRLAQSSNLTALLLRLLSQDGDVALHAVTAVEKIAALTQHRQMLSAVGTQAMLLRFAQERHAEEHQRIALRALEHLGPAAAVPGEVHVTAPTSGPLMLVRIIEASDSAHLIRVPQGCTLPVLRRAIEDAGVVMQNCDLAFIDRGAHSIRISSQNDFENVMLLHGEEFPPTAHQARSLTLHVQQHTTPAAELASGGALPRSLSATSDEAASKFASIDASELKLADRVGVGACGEVFKGSWRGSAVAVKRMFDDGSNEDLVRDFRNEVSMLLHLRHPNIVLFMGAVANGEQLCIVTEFAARGSLYRVLHKGCTALSWPRRLAMAIDAARGVNFLHTHSPVVVHRDLKSPNLLVDKSWTVKVADFGLARTKRHYFVSQGCGGVGTPEWTAPEVLKDEEFNEKADVYSYGVVLWELISRLKPFAGLSAMQIVVAVGFNGERLPPPTGSAAVGVPAELLTLLTQCTANVAEKRPRLAEVIPQLERLLKGAATAAKARARTAADQ